MKIDYKLKCSWVKVIFINFCLFFSIHNFSNASLANISKIDSLKKILNKYPDTDTNKIVILNKLSFGFYSINPDSGINYGLKAVQLSLKIGDENLLAKAYNAIGVCYWTKSDYTQALNYIFKALNINELKNNKQQLANNYNNIGLIYWNQFDYKEAFEYINKGCKINLELKDEAALSNSYNNLGILNNDQLKYDLAISYFYKSIELNEKLGNYVDCSINYGNLAVSYERLNKLELAEEYATKAYNIAVQYENKFSKVIQIDRLSSVYLSIAKDSVLKSSTIRKEYLEKSINFACSGIILAKELDARKQLLSLYLTLTEIYEYLNDWQQIAKYSKLYRELNAKINGAETSVYFQQLNQQRKHETNANEIKLLKKDRENRNTFLLASLISIVLLIIILSLILTNYKKSKKVNLFLSEQNRIINDSAYELDLLNKELSSRESELTQLNAAKDKFFSIIAHDLRNPIGSYTGLIEFIYDNYSLFSEEEIKKNLLVVSKSSKSVFELLENLLAWAKTQSGNIDFTPQHVNIKYWTTKALEALETHAKNKDIELNINVDTNVYVFADTNMLMTMLRNLVSNAIKFTNIGGEINIDIESDESFVKIAVSDNGIGMSEDTLSKLFKIEHNLVSRGTGNEKGSGLGLILCNEFVNYHNGSIKVESCEGQGSTFTIALPANKMA